MEQSCWCSELVSIGLDCYHSLADIHQITNKACHLVNMHVNLSSRYGHI